MNFKTTLVLLVLVAIGAAVWFATGRRSPSAETNEAAEPDTPQARHVLDPRPENKDILRVEFERRDEAPLVFQRSLKESDPSGLTAWRMTAPVDSAAEPYLVDGLVRLATSLQYRRSLAVGGEGGVSLADAGLEPPVAKLTLTDKEDQQYTLQIGKRLPLSNDTYVRVGGKDQIYVVGRDMKRELERKANEYRSKNVLQFTVDDARHLRIEHAGSVYDLTRTADDEWVINEPIKAYAQVDKVKNLVTSLGTLRVKEFIDDTPRSLARYGLDSPFVKFALTTEKKELVLKESEPQESSEIDESGTETVEPTYETVISTFSLAVGAFADLKSESRYLKLEDQPWVASVSSEQVKKLIPELSDLRDPRITRVKANAVTRLEITRGEVSAAIERENGKWLGVGDLSELEPDAVDKLLAAFEDVRAVDYIDQPQENAAYGFDPPRAVISVNTSGAVEPVTLEIGNDTPSGRNTYVRLAGQPAVMVISADRAAELAVEPISLRSRVITSTSPQRINRVELQAPGRHYVLERPAGAERWQMLEPAAAPPDNTAVRDLVNDLARLRARKVVDKDNAEAYGLTPADAITIRFDVDQPVEEAAVVAAEGQPASAPVEPQVQPIRHTLLVRQKEGRAFACIDDEPYIFELDETVFEVMTQELIDRGLFDIEGDAVTHLEIEAPGGTLEFERRDDEWIYPPDEFVKLSQKRVGDFVKELAELRVDAYVAYYEADPAAYGLDDAPVTVTMRLADGSAITLKIDQVRRGELPRKAAWIEQQRVFILHQAEAEKLMRGLDYYVKQAQPDQAADTP